MKFSIPTANTRLKITKPWTFLVYIRERNAGLFYGIGDRYVRTLPWVTLPKEYPGGISEDLAVDLSFIKHTKGKNNNLITYYSNALQLTLMPKTILDVLAVSSCLTNAHDPLSHNVALQIVKTNHPVLLAGPYQDPHVDVAIKDFEKLSCEIINQE